MNLDRAAMRVWQRIDHVPDGVTVVNRFGEFYTGSFVAYGRDVRFSWAEQPSAPFTENRGSVTDGEAIRDLPVRRQLRTP